MLTNVLVLMLAQVGSPPAAPQTSPPRSAQAEKPVPALLVAGLAVLGAGIAAQTVDVLLATGPANPRAQGLLGLAVVPLVGSALFGFSGFRDPPLAAFNARALAWLGVQVVGTVLALLWGFVDDESESPTLSLGPVNGGWVVSAGRRF
ncbi:MAG: hypothetical protein MUC96_14580 [Myxococcaceae bacterium]|jgi:hypothetical protein|nr:hypothetical protein [Myxococcaceae bacterium]